MNSRYVGKPRTATTGLEGDESQPHSNKWKPEAKNCIPQNLMDGWVLDITCVPLIRTGFGHDPCHVPSGTGCFWGQQAAGDHLLAQARSLLTQQPLGQ